MASSQRRTKLIELSYNLRERVKELHCLYSISRIFENKDNSIDKALQAVVEIIPAAWQYPEITCSSIKLKRKDFSTTNYSETQWRQVQNILVNGRHYGILEVCYLKPKPDCDEGPFLKEERNLLRVISDRLSIAIEHHIADKNLEILYKREKRLREQLQAEMKSRADLTQKLIHELKTPLTSLIANSQLLSDETKDPKLSKLAHYIWIGAENMNRRIEELHDVIRGEMGQLRLRLRQVNIERLLISVLEEVNPLAKQNNMVIKLEVDTNLPDINADADRLHQIILNLINNALIYANEGGRIIIKATCNSDSILIEVRDYGPGISVKQRQVLFEPGYQVAYRKQLTGGLGIGLSLCKMLVELHGGKIWVKSKMGYGTSFFFTLPIRHSGIK